MKKRNIFISAGIVIAAFIVVFVFMGTRRGEPEVGQYFPGGRNIEAFTYETAEGYPSFPDRTNFAGTLTGTWYEMGKQFGERAGESTRYVSDIWWKAECEQWGKKETLKAFELYEAQIAALDPALIDFMKGITDGAAPWLNKSPYADPSHSLYAANYQRVLAVNLWDEWSMQHPRAFPDGSSTFGGSQKAPDKTCLAGCSAFAARGKVTMHGELISAHNRHSPFNPRCYEQVYIIKPSDGNSCWVLTNSPQAAANQVVNDKGLSLSLLWGGITNPKSLNYKGESYCAEGFGAAWFHLFLYIGTHADNAEQAIEMLTLGTPGYRSRTGRKTLLRGGAWNFLVADKNTLAVVETSANRYAVRYAGDVLPFNGPGWNNPDYIVATNHYICDFSYDENNNRTDVPMTIFSDGYYYDRDTGEKKGCNESGLRYWTLMWDIKHHYGRIDKYRAQQIMSGFYRYEVETGKKIDVMKDKEGVWRIYGYVWPSTLGFISPKGGTCDSKIALMQGKSISINWTMGSPYDWQGAWDEFRFSPGPD